MEITEGMEEKYMLEIVSLDAKDTIRSRTEGIIIVTMRYLLVKEILRMSVTMSVPFAVFQDTMSNIVMLQYISLRIWQPYLLLTYFNKLIANNLYNQSLQQHGY